MRNVERDVLLTWGRYSKSGKIVTPITDEEFAEGMNTGHFISSKHRAYCVLLFYTAVRRGEGLKATREQFTITNENIIFNVGKRFKGSSETVELFLPLDKPYMNLLKEAIENTKPRERVFPYCGKTGYNIVTRAFKYPHLMRLTRITDFFRKKWDIASVKSWTGLSVGALDYYVGLVRTQEMGKSL
jgi:integrase